MSATRLNPLKATLATLAVLVPLGALALALPPDGKERADWIQFVGRFHPLAVHLPIGLLLLVPLMELLGCFQRTAFLRPAAGFVLGLAALSAVAAVVVGWLLAYAGGYSGDLVERHMWGGIALAGVCWLAIFLRPRPASAGTAGSRLGYALALTTGLGLLTWTSHQGGSLTRGENYLTEQMPEPLRRLLGVKPPGSAMAVHEPADAFYATHVQPIFENHCVLCHSASKVKGNLRLDSFAQLMKGGESGASIVPSEPGRSELYRRITLPGDHKEFMPSEGKKPLTEPQVKRLEQWIALGASSTATLTDLKAAGAELPDEDAPAVIVPLAPDYRPFAAQILELEKKLHVRLVPVSQQATDGLILRTVNNPGMIDDATLAQLAPVTALIVDAELARTKVSDAGLATLGRFENLRKLDLSHTAVTAAGLPALGTLAYLEWLNLVGTAVGEDAAATLATFPALKKSYRL